MGSIDLNKFNPIVLQKVHKWFSIAASELNPNNNLGQVFVIMPPPNVLIKKTKSSKIATELKGHYLSSVGAPAIASIFLFTNTNYDK